MPSYYLDLNKWSFLFLAFELLVCSFFFVVYKVVTFFLFKKKIKIIFKYLLYIFIGGLVSLLFFGLENFFNFFIFKNESREEVFYFLPLITIAFVYFLAIRQHLLIAGSGYLTLLLQLLAFKNWSFDTINLFCLFLMIINIGNVILNLFIKKTKETQLIFNYLVNYVIGCILLMFMALIVKQSFDSLTNIIFLSMASVIGAIIAYSIFLFIFKFVIKIASKSKQLVYMDEYFVLPKLILNYFHNLRKTTQKKHYWIITFYLENMALAKKQWSLKKYQEFEQQYLNQIAKKFEEYNGFLFKSKYGSYGAILPIKQPFFSNLNIEYAGNLVSERYNADALKEFEKILASLDKTLKINKETIQIKTKMVVSIYGIHGVDIDELINCNYLYLKQFVVFNSNLIKNCVQLVNPRYILQINEQTQSYKKILSFIDQTEFDIELKEVMINNHTYIQPQYFWLKKFTCNLSKILSYFDQQSGCLLQRYLALKAIEKYSTTNKKYQLLVDYPIHELNSITFSASKILNKIQVFNLTNKDVILFFSGKNFIYDDQFTNNLQDLDNNQITYLFAKGIDLQPKYNFK